MKKFFSAILIACLMIVMPLMVSCDNNVDPVDPKEPGNSYTLTITCETDEVTLGQPEKIEMDGYYYSFLYDGDPLLYFSSSVDIGKKVDENTNVKLVLYISLFAEDLAVKVNNEPITLEEPLLSENDEFNYVEFSFNITQDTNVVISGKFI